MGVAASNRVHIAPPLKGPPAAIRAPVAAAPVDMEAIVRRWSGILDGAEVHTMLDTFHVLTGGAMVASFEDFDSKLTVLYGMARETKHRFFFLCDVDHDGFVQFADFVTVMAAFRSGDEETLCRAVFNLYSDGTEMTADGCLRLQLDAAGKVADQALAHELEELAALEAELACTAVTRIVHLTQDEDNVSSTVSKLTAATSVLLQVTPGDDAPRTPPRSSRPAVAGTASFEQFTAWCQSPVSPDLSVWARRFSLRRTPSLERDTMAELVSGKEPAAGETWCLLSAKWWETWVEYSGFVDPAGTLASRKASAPVVGRGTRHSVVMNPSRVVVDSGVFAGVAANAGTSRSSTRASVSSARSTSAYASPVPPRLSSALDAEATGSPVLYSRRASAEVPPPSALSGGRPPAGLPRPKPSKAAAAHKPQFTNATSSPGPIDNLDLQGDRPDLVRTDAAEHTDFVLLPEAAWAQLICWYGGGPTFPRRAVDWGADELPVGMGLSPRKAGGGAPQPPSRVSVEVWPLPLYLSYQVPASDPHTADFEVRVGSRQAWATLMVGGLMAGNLLAEAAHEGQVANLSAMAVVKAALEAMPTTDFPGLRLHVKVDLQDGRQLAYRLDTRDPCVSVESGLLQGGESLVLEKRDGTKPWALPSIKGDGLWMDFEAEDYVDVRDRASVWRPAQILKLADVAVVQFEGAPTTVCVPMPTDGERDGVTLGDFAPYYTQSFVHAAPPVAAMSKQQPKARPHAVLEAKSDEDDGEVPRGATGLQNLGNTCYMNSTLQCLSHATPLTEYFLSGAYKRDVNKENPLGLGGKLVSVYVRLLKDLWSGRHAALNPIKFKVMLSDLSPQFAGFNQHDCQELLTFLLDGLHEEVNTVMEKPYTTVPDADGRSDAIVAAESWGLHLLRNRSAVVDLLQGQLKSTIACPQPGCGKMSVTFDPFLFLSLSIPFETHKNIRLLFVPLQAAGAPRAATILSMRVERRARVSQIAGVISEDAGVPAQRLVVADIYQGRVYKTLSERKRVSNIRDTDVIVAYEIAEDVEALVEVGHERPVTTSEGAFSAIRSPTARRKPKPPSFAPCGLPLVVSVSGDVTGTKLHGAVTGQLSVMTGVRVDPSLYKVVVVSRALEGCGLCTRRSCQGCELPNTLDLIELAAEDASLVLRWSEEGFKVVEAAITTETPFENTGASGRTRLSINSLLEGFSKEEVLGETESWYCSKCETHRQARKWLNLYSMPDVLVLHLKRFSFQADRREKISSHVDFPLEGLDLSAFVQVGGSPSDDPAADRTAAAAPVYDLFAVSNHYGTLGGGHYTALACNPTNRKWYHFDDDHVEVVDPTTAVSGTHAYVLYYRRR